MSEFRFAFQQLFKHPGFTAAAVLSLAVGIGINSLVFGLLDAVLLRPLPFDDPGRIVRIHALDDKNRRQKFSFSTYAWLNQESHCFSGLTAVFSGGGMLKGDDQSELIFAEIVSRNYFEVLGIAPRLGRTFTNPEDAAKPVAVISHGMWERRFGCNQQVLGQSILLAGRRFEVVGVAPKGFGGIHRITNVELWYPVEVEADSVSVMSPERRGFELLARLAPGIDFEHAQQDIDKLASKSQADNLLNDSSTRFTMVRETDNVGLGDSGASKRPAYLLLLMVFLVLVVACINVSGLLLARSEARRVEMATRLALGSTRQQLMRQFLKESLALALLASGLCLLLVRLALLILPQLLPALPIALDLGLRLDYRIVAYTFFLASLSILIFGLGPALRASRGDLTPLLKAGPFAGTPDPRRYLIRRVLLVGQLSVSLVFLAMGAAFLLCFIRGLNADLGFERKNLALIPISPESQGYSEQPARAYYQTLVARLQNLPGVKAVALARRAPLSQGGEGATQDVILPGDEASPERPPRPVHFNIVSTNYFAVMGTRLLRGRLFEPRDQASSPKVVLVSDTTAQQFWPGQDPLGQTLRIGDRNTNPLTVIGVVQDAKHTAPREKPGPYVYFPFSQMHWSTMTLLIETTPSPGSLSVAIRREMRALDKKIEPVWITTLKDTIQLALLPERFVAGLMGALGVLALLLAVIGLFGLVSFTVKQHTHEIGVRIALGATRISVLAMFLRRGLNLTLISLLLGLPSALALNRAIVGAEFYGANPNHPLIYLSAGVVLVCATLLACYLPANRAAQVDPITALRYE